MCQQLVARATRQQTTVALNRYAGEGSHDGGEKGDSLPGGETSGTPYVDPYGSDNEN